MLLALFYDLLSLELIKKCNFSYRTKNVVLGYCSRVSTGISLTKLFEPLVRVLFTKY